MDVEAGCGSGPVGLQEQTEGCFALRIRRAIRGRRPRRVDGGLRTARTWSRSQACRPDRRLVTRPRASPGGSSGRRAMQRRVIGTRPQHPASTRGGAFDAPVHGRLIRREGDSVRLPGRPQTPARPCGDEPHGVTSTSGYATSWAAAQAHDPAGPHPPLRGSVRSRTRTVGSLASFGAKSHPGTKHYYGTSGNSFVAVVEFRPRLRVWAVTAGGGSGHPARRTSTTRPDATRAVTAGPSISPSRDHGSYRARLHTERVIRLSLVRPNVGH